MSTPESVTIAQTGFAIAGFIPMWLGFRAGRITRPDGYWSLDLERVNMPMVWVGLTIWTVGGLFALTRAIIWFSPFGIVLAGGALAIDVYLWYTAVQVQRRLGAGPAHPSAHDEGDAAS